MSEAPIRPVLKWVGGTDMIGKLFSSVLDKIIGGVG